MHFVIALSLFKIIVAAGYDLIYITRVIRVPSRELPKFASNPRYRIVL
jgi:hypothetical protein